MHLEHPLGPRQVAEAVVAEIDDHHAVGEVVASEVDRGLRHHDLTAVGSAHEPGRSVQRRAVVVALAQLRGARVDAHAYQQCPGRRPVLRAERELRVDRSRDRVRRGRERGMHTVTRGLHDVTVVTLDRRAQDLVVARQRALHRFGVLLPEARRTLEIGEEEGDRPRREPREVGGIGGSPALGHV